jgi:N-acetylglucosamine-6-phosphate deacetylase
VNGYAGVDFNQDDLSGDDLHRVCQRLANEGVRGILATIITEEISVMARRLRRLVELRDADPLIQSVIAGLHIEGPFLNPTPGYRGAHPVDAICPATVDAMEHLLEAGAGQVRLVTLAPEQDASFSVARVLSMQGIAVSAGHCDPSLDTLDAAIDAGLTLFTHLGNGCPMEMHRHDNIIQRVLSRSDRLWITFIGDGVHVPFFALRNYLSVVGEERAIIVTDAMTAAGLGPGRYTLGRWDVEVGEDGAAWAPDRSHLVGAAITMPQCAANLRTHLGFSEETIRRLTFDNPRKAVLGTQERATL